MGSTQQPAAEQREAALEWFVRLRDAELGAQERQAFEAWRRADPRHEAAYREAERLWAALDEIAPPAAEVEVPEQALPPSPTRSAQARRRRQLAPALAIAAGLAAAVVVTVFTLGVPAPVSGLLADYRTAAGERESLHLADGTAVELNGASALSVDFTPGRRSVFLHDGEAFFQVARDAGRPFTVQTALGKVEVLGTAFAVTTGDDFVEVTVTESRVAVTHATGARAELGAGQHLRLDRRGLGSVAVGDTAEALAWRSGRLVFRNTPLAEVIGALERQRPGRIALMDPSLHALKVTGSFAPHEEGADAGDKVLDAIEAALAVRLVRLTDYLVLIFPQERS